MILVISSIKHLLSQPNFNIKGLIGFLLYPNILQVQPSLEFIINQVIKSILKYRLSGLLEQIGQCPGWNMDFLVLKISPRVPELKMYQKYCSRS